MDLEIPVGSTASLSVPSNAMACKINDVDISVDSESRMQLLDSGFYNVIFTF